MSLTWSILLRCSRNKQFENLNVLNDTFHMSLLFSHTNNFTGMNAMYIILHFFHFILLHVLQPLSESQKMLKMCLII